METRSVISSRREKERLKKRRQRTAPEMCRRELLAQAKRRAEKKKEKQMMEEDINGLRDQVRRLKQKVSTLEELNEEKCLEVSILRYSAVDTYEQNWSMMSNEVVWSEISSEEDSTADNEINVCEQEAKRIYHDDLTCRRMTSYATGEIDAMVEEMEKVWERTTYRGEERKRNVGTERRLVACLILTLIWLYHYPTLGFLASLFQLHERTVTQILRKTIIVMATCLEKEVQWPTDQEMESVLRHFIWFQNKSSKRLHVL